ncbi:uncharacterized protein LOC123535035 [Mercenaria mercenaria]|uniref:uncharacterized protein LOC123535035 n=1 Tax=Mercenaria mercenaria TaxID=6596 RepID=UPI00234F440B|nr:uncharacterized protein LOC123535035 [Mercenaria mercenaria]
MQYILNSLILVIFLYINMTIATENGISPTLKTNVEVATTTMVKLTDITETVQEINTSSSLVYEHIHMTEISASEFTENKGLLNDTTEEFDNKTNESDYEVDDIHSSFNLAIIPTVAVFVFIVITCIKCCKWFQQYTRRDSKDDLFYAVVVTDDDKEHGHTDITLESASAACYDTVYSSSLKYGGNGNVLSSIRTWLQDCIKSGGFKSSLHRIEQKNVNCETYIKQVTSLRYTGNKTDETIDDLDVRFYSTSSAETVSEHLPDSPAIRHNNGVSILTETIPITVNNKTPNGNINHEKLIRSKLKKSSTATSSKTTSTVSRLEGTHEETKMVDVGIQTNKSFMYSLSKSKGHAGNSDLGEKLSNRLSTSTSALQLEESQLIDDNMNTLSENSDKIEACKWENYSSISHGENRKSSNSTDFLEISKYPFDPKVEVIQYYKQTKETDGELDDDVLKEDMRIDSEPKNKTTAVETCNTVNKRSMDDSSAGLTKSEIYLCSHCKTKSCRNIVDPVCDESRLLASDINPVIQRMCEKCKSECKHKTNNKNLQNRK